MRQKERTACKKQSAKAWVTHKAVDLVTKKTDETIRQISTGEELEYAEF